MRAVMIALLPLAAVQVRLNYEGALIGGIDIDICHLHHMQCRCQIFQPGVKISRINAFFLCFLVWETLIRRAFWCQFFC